MGIDITMHLISKEGDIIVANIFEDRDYRWFENISENGEDIEYDYFPCKHGAPENLSLELIFEAYCTDYNYGFRYVNVKDFIEWYQEKRPNEDAGWVSTYEKYLYDNKGIAPKDVCRCLDEIPIGVKDDFHFLVFEKEHEPSRTLYYKLYKLAQEGVISYNMQDYYLCYCFNR